MVCLAPSLIFVSARHTFSPQIARPFLRLYCRPSCDMLPDARSDAGYRPEPGRLAR